MTKQCVKCGADLPDEARFCMTCGAPQAGAPPATEALLAGDGGISQGSGDGIGAGGVKVGGNVGGDVVTGKKETHYHGIAGAKPAQLREAYLHHVMATAGRVSLSGIDPKATSEREAQLSLSAVYTGMLTLTPEESERMKNNDHLPEALGRETRRLSIVAQLDRHPRLVLLGDPGSGKTTFVNFVALCLAGSGLGDTHINLDLLRELLPQKEDKEPELQPWQHGALLPVRVVLRDFAARGLPPQGETATAKHLWDFIVAELRAAALEDYAPYLRRELQERGGLLLLDGLDEVPQAEERRVQIKQVVEAFVGSFGKCRVLVTSRTYAYQQQAWRLQDFAETVLAPFGEGQIERFITRWYAHTAHLRGLNQDDAAGRATLLTRAIQGSTRLQALAARPLLLTLMASLHAWRGGNLPEKREELYADTVDLLLDWWEQPKIVRDKDCVIVQQPSLAEWLRVDRDEVRKLLNRLAYTAHARQPDLAQTADIDEGELLAGLLHLSRNPDVNPAKLVEYLSVRAGLLVPRGVGVYTFPHRTFQEYLAACYLTDAEYPDKVAELARADPHRWREVALLAGAKAASGTASAVWSLVDALCYECSAPSGNLPEAAAWGALLAGQALVESAGLATVSQRNRPKVARVQTHLAQLLAQATLPAVERVAAGVTLAKIGDARPGVGVLPNGLPDIVWAPVPAGPFLMGSTDEDRQARSSEKPQHTYVIEKPYWISRYPVTNAQYATFVQAGGYGERRYWTDAGWGIKESEKWQGPENYRTPFDLPNHPVVGVSWYEAVAFCRWLTERMQEAGCKIQVWENDLFSSCVLPLASCTVQLPSEAEWEKVARGTDGWIYPWGNDPDPEKANYGDTGIGSTSAVGCFAGGASLYGAEDLSGNVLEWCRTKWEGNYEQYQDNDALEDSVHRVLRGGAFNLNVRYVRCAFRHSDLPVSRDFDLGFRVVVSPSAL